MTALQLVRRRFDFLLALHARKASNADINAAVTKLGAAISEAEQKEKQRVEAEAPKP